MHIRVKILEVFFTLLLSLVVVSNAKSQFSQIEFEHLTVDDGLSQSIVLCLLQDSKGYIWMGTQDGLNKYDGYTFHFYKYDPLDNNSLSSNWINALAEDNNGNIWVGTQKGLNRIDRKTGIITRFLYQPNNPYSISENEVFAIGIDNNGIIWVKTTIALNKFDTKTERFYRFEHTQDYFSQGKSDKGVPIYIEESGIWIGTLQGLLFFNTSFEHFKMYHHDERDTNTISNNIVTGILPSTSKDFLWITTRNGINYFNKRLNKFSRHYPEPINISSPKNSITCAFMSFNNTIWMGTSGGGLLNFNPKTNKYENFVKLQYEYNSLSYNYIASIIEDRSHNLWIGMDGTGIDRLDLKPKNFTTYRRSLSKEGINLSSNFLGSIYTDIDSILWIGTWENGLDIFNRATGEVKNINIHGKEGRRLVGNNVHVILKLKNNLKWIGTRNGISVYNPDTDLFYDVFKYYEFNFVPNFNNVRIYDMYEDSRGNIWVGTKNGLYMFDMKKFVIYPFWSNFYDKNSLSDNSVIHIKEDSQGFIWIGTSNGLNKFDYKTQKFYRLGIDLDTIMPSNNGRHYIISSSYIYSILEDSHDGSMWIGTSSGLNNFDKSTGTFKYYTVKDGIPNDMIYEIQQDSKGNLWFSTNRGLGRLDKATGRIRSYDMGDGLQGLEYNNGASFKNKKGELFFGGASGLNVFHPDSMKDNVFIPNVVITRLEKSKDNEKSIININENQTLVLSHLDHNITIYFAALEFTKSKKNNYMYMMQNLNDNWINVGTRNFQEFSNLPPGEYIFRVRGSNNDLVWSEQVATLKIIVKPPYYKTKIAYLLYFLLIISTIYFVVRSRTRKLQEANQVLRMKQLAAIEIAKQKEELTLKNKNITDSINYAKRIQEAMLPSEWLLRKLLPQSFILYKPKDIVSGDFYWISEKNNKIYIAAVDCTGHGVPGAFMSIIGFDLLRSITKEQGVEDPAEILNLLDIGVSETFSKNLEEKSVKDGMDISLAVIDKNTKKIYFAGAFNPLLIIRNNKIIEIKGNRFSVGRTENEDQKFDKHTIDYKQGDMIYIFSDGYADQFGGPIGKKMKLRRFRHILLTISKMPLIKQREFLDQSFDNWKGELEQVDDILVIGVRLT